MNDDRSKKETAFLAAEALKTVATAASEALVKVAAEAASAQAKMTVDIGYIKSDISTIKTDMKAAQVYYASSASLINVNRLISDHETRLRTIETNMWKLVGGLSVLSALIGSLGGRVSELIFK